MISKLTGKTDNVKDGHEMLTQGWMNGYMCSQFCPCEDGPNIEAWIKYDKEKLKVMRTVPTVEGDLKDKPLPFWFGDKKYEIGDTEGVLIDPAVDITPGKKFKTFEECANYVFELKCKDNEANCVAPYTQNIAKNLHYYSNTNGKN